MDPPASFDLTTPARDAYGYFRSFRALLYIITASFGLLWIFFVLLNLARGTLLQNFEMTYGVPYWGPFVGMGICLSAVWKTQLGPVQATLADDSLQFRWASGKTDLLPWSSSKFRLTLLDRNIGSARRRSSILWSVARWNRPQIYLTEAAFSAVLDAGRIHGLSVVTTTPSPILWGVCRMTRIRGAARGSQMSSGLE